MILVKVLHLRRARATYDPPFISDSYVLFDFFQSLANQEKVFPQQLTDSGPLQGAGHNKVGATLRWPLNCSNMLLLKKNAFKSFLPARYSRAIWQPIVGN